MPQLVNLDARVYQRTWQACKAWGWQWPEGRCTVQHQDEHGSSGNRAERAATVSPTGWTWPG